MYALSQLRDENWEAELADSAEAERLGTACVKPMRKWFIFDIRPWKLYWWTAESEAAQSTRRKRERSYSRGAPRLKSYL